MDQLRGAEVVLTSARRQEGGTTMALEFGSQGDAVMRVQQALIDQGLDPGPVDGRFGPGTENAVKAFQTNHGLTADGIVGNATWSALGLPGSVPKPVRFD